jgi:hypothetical protein
MYHVAVGCLVRPSGSIPSAAPAQCAGPTCPLTASISLRPCFRWAWPDSQLYAQSVAVLVLPRCFATSSKLQVALPWRVMSELHNSF